MKWNMNALEMVCAAAEWNGTISFSLQNTLFHSRAHMNIAYRYFFLLLLLLLLFLFAFSFTGWTSERSSEKEESLSLLLLPLFPLFLSNILLLPSSSSSSVYACTLYNVHHIKESLSAYNMHVLYPVSESEIITRYFIRVLAALPIKKNTHTHTQNLCCFSFLSFFLF